MARHYVAFAVICAMLSLFTLGTADTSYLNVVIITTELIPNLFGSGSLTMTATWTSSNIAPTQTTYTTVTTTMAPDTVTITIVELTGTVSSNPKSTEGLCYLSGNLLEKCSGLAKPTIQSNSAVAVKHTPIGQIIKYLKLRFYQAEIPAHNSIRGSLRKLTKIPLVMKPGCSLGSFTTEDIHCPQTSAAIPAMVNPLKHLIDSIKSLRSLFPKVNTTQFTVDNFELSHSHAINSLTGNIVDPRDDKTTPIESPFVNSTVESNATELNSTTIALYQSYCSSCSEPPLLMTPILLWWVALIHTIWLLMMWSDKDNEKNFHRLTKYLVFWTVVWSVSIYAEYYIFSTTLFWQECLDNGCAAFLGNHTINATAAAAAAAASKQSTFSLPL